MITGTALFTVSFWVAPQNWDPSDGFFHSFFECGAGNDGKGWLVVGIGSEKGAPIPKLDEDNKLLGYWSAESFQMQPGVAQISQENFGARNDDNTVTRFLLKETFPTAETAIEAALTTGRRKGDVGY